MAIYPCDWSAHRYAQPQQSAYITSVWGTDAETAQLRLCPRHLLELEEICKERLELIDWDSQVGSSCTSCGKERNGLLSVKLFKGKEEPTYYVADLCARCWQEYRTLLKVASGRPPRARSDD